MCSWLILTFYFCVLKVLEKDIAIAVARYLKEDEAFLPPPRYKYHND